MKIPQRPLLSWANEWNERKQTDADCHTQISPDSPAHREPVGAGQPHSRCPIIRESPEPLTPGAGVPVLRSRMKKRYTSQGPYIHDNLREKKFFGRAVFDVYGGEFDELHFDAIEREKVFLEIGGRDEAIKVLKAAFAAQNKPYDAEHVIDTLIAHNFERNALEVYDDQSQLRTYLGKVVYPSLSLKLEVMRREGKIDQERADKLEETILERVYNIFYSKDELIKRCARCFRIPISPGACSCKWCFHTWYDQKAQQKEYEISLAKKVLSLIDSEIWLKKEAARSG